MILDDSVIFAEEVLLRINRILARLEKRESEDVEPGTNQTPQRTGSDHFGE